MTRNVLVLGATSAIAQATCRRLARQGPTRFLLIARDADKLAQCGADISSWGADQVDRLVADLGDIDAHRRLMDQVWSTMPVIDFAIIAYGTLYDSKRSWDLPELALQEISTNFSSQTSLLRWLATGMSERRAGTLVVLSSVAGERGRASNFNYGSSKAGITAFAEGLRGYLAPLGVHVCIIKLGIVDTPMSHPFHSGGLLVSEPDTVAKDIVSGMLSKRKIVYSPWFWRPLMWVIRSLPCWLFDRLRI